MNDLSRGFDRGRLSPTMVSFRLLVLEFVREYIERMGESPSYGEIAAALNTNRERVRKAVRSLCRDGMLVRVPGPRGLRLPSERDELFRQLRRLGFDPSGLTNPPPLPPPELDYPSQPAGGGSGHGKQGSEATEQGA